MTDNRTTELLRCLETTLLPCPFCGGEYAQVRYMGGKWQEPSAFDSGYRGECCDCGAITAACDTEAEAIAAWNARAERTCEMELTELSSGSAYHDVWLCSACGEQVEQHTVMGKSEPPRYCPNCGARVVDA